MGALQPLIAEAQSANFPDISVIDFSMVKTDSCCPPIEEIPALCNVDPEKLQTLMTKMQEIVNLLEER